MNAQRPELQVAVAAPAGARIAVEGGADSVELCTALELGGLTPSPALLDATVATGAQVHVLIRPRPGDFIFAAEDVAVMAADAGEALRRGAHGVVIGALSAEGRVDLAATRAVIAAAREAAPGAVLTFHRAIDHVAEPWRELPALAELGIDRVLSSGGASRAIDGVATLGRLAGAPHPVTVIAGGGVRPEDIGPLQRAGVSGVHLSAKRRSGPAGGHWIPLGAGVASAAEDTHFVTDLDLVRAASAAVQSG
ncbi:MAG TPA: copper homeostasis protein CutC [Beutenbergiaceae bacterium]|nr:copper homeostasis protein CutC [Beutenbergiaceae bacterium]